MNNPGADNLQEHDIEPVKVLKVLVQLNPHTVVM